jgi:hypothetical protein
MYPSARNRTRILLMIYPVDVQQHFLGEPIFLTFAGSAYNGKIGTVETAFGGRRCPTASEVNAPDV